jgi:hypothetical protein
MATKGTKAGKEVKIVPDTEVMIQGRLARTPRFTGEKNFAAFSVKIPYTVTDKATGLDRIANHYLGCTFVCGETKPEWMKEGQMVRVKGKLSTWRKKLRQGEIHVDKDGKDANYPQMTVVATEVTPLQI